MADPTTDAPPPGEEPVAIDFYRMPSVLRRTGLCRSTIYKLIAENKFPSPVRLAGRAVGWRRTDLDRWSESRPSTAH